MISREWAMPNRFTFQIKPIEKLVKKYVSDGIGWIDPFCGSSTLAEFRNDLNPDNKNAQEHKEAVEYLKFMSEIGPVFNGVLFDPPYSPRQITEVYKSIGKEINQGTTQNAKLYSQCRDEIAKLLRPSGIVISFGWNSTGMGKTRGFEMIEMLIVNHGSAHNDTIVIVERKL